MQNDLSVNANLRKPLEVLMQECRGHFDRSIVAEVYRERRWPHFADTFDRSDSLEEFLQKTIRYKHDQVEFLAYYLEALKSSVAGKANCGCVHYAEDGIPCEHDLALLGQSVQS
jgi:hypothetical protein